jgi:hypothetical protein
MLLNCPAAADIRIFLVQGDAGFIEGKGSGDLKKYRDPLQK